MKATIGMINETIEALKEFISDKKTKVVGISKSDAEDIVAFVNDIIEENMELKRKNSELTEENRFLSRAIAIMRDMECVSIEKYKKDKR